MRKGLELRDSLVPIGGIAVAALLLMGIGLLTLSQRLSVRAAEAQALLQRAASLGATLSHPIETMLIADDLPGVRRVVLDVARRHGLAECRVVLADGGVLADSTDGAVVLPALPAQWDGVATAVPVTAPATGAPLLVPGRGEAMLITAPAEPRPLAAGTFVTPVFAVGVGVMLLGLAGWLFRRRSADRGLDAIRAALVELESGETASSMLRLADDLGREASLWNAMIDERETWREAAARNQACDRLASRQERGTDLARVFDTLWDGVLVVNDEMVVSSANGAAAVMLQRPRESVNGTRLADLVPPPVLEMVASAFSRSGGTRPTVEIESTESAESAILRYSARLIRASESTEALLVVEDVTQQRVADTAHHAFVTQATHELRTPLTNISLYANMLIEDHEVDQETREKCLNVINQESKRLEHIINDMLSVAEIEAGSMQLSTDDVHLLPLIDTIVAEYRVQATEKEQEIRLDLPPKLPVMQADRGKLTLVLHNLIGNAIKYTPRGGRITVSVDLADDRIQVHVEDTGIGIAESDLPNIFDRFYRADDPRLAAITGSGLGLALAREVARLHGGDITVDSIIDQGSTFHLALPVSVKVA